MDFRRLMMSEEQIPIQGRHRGISTTWEEALPGRHRGPVDIVEAFSSRVGTAWNNISCADLLGLSETASQEAAVLSQRGNNNAACTPSIPVSNSRFHDSLQKSNPPLTNQNFTISSNLLNNSNYSPHIPQYGIHVPYHPPFDLNSPSGPFADATSNGPISFQFSPVTPPQGRRAQNQHSAIANIHVEEGSDLVKNKQQKAVDQQTNDNEPNRRSRMASARKRKEATTVELEQSEPETERGLMMMISSSW